MSCESLEVDGCETLVLEVEAPVLLEVAEQGPPGPPGAPGEPGPPGTTDYNDLTNKPTLGTAAAQNVEVFATAAQGAKADSAVQAPALSTTNSNVDSLSTSTSSGLSTAASGIASLSTGLSTALSSGLSTTNSGVVSLSTSSSSGLSTATSSIVSLSTSTSSGLSTASSRIASLSSSASTGLSTATSGIVSLSTSLSSTSSSVGSLSTSASSGLSTATSGINSLSTSTSTALSTAASNVSALDSQNVKLTGAQSITGLKTVSVPLAGSSGTAVAWSVAPTVTQTGTAGYTALDVSVTQTTVGSGVPLLQRWAVNSVVYGSMRSNGHLSTRGLVTAGSVDGLTTGTSYLSALGSFAVAPTTLTVDTTLGITHGSILLNPTTTPVVITLPAVSTCPGRVYPIKRLDGVLGAHTIVPNGAELIDASNRPYQLTRQYSGVVLRSTGTRWVTEAVFEPLAISQQAPVVNIMSDSGRGTVKANPLSRAVGAFNAARIEAFLAANNGAGAWAEVGKFIHDNTTNGGGMGVLTATTSDLLAAMGRTSTSARYGVEFYIVERTAGTGTSLPSTTYLNNYLATTNGGAAMFGAGNTCTFVGWLRCIDLNQLVIRGGSVWLNGTRATGGEAVITPAMGWVHVRVVAPSAIGYDNAFPYVYTEVGQKWQLALPGFFLGYVDPGIHLAPLATINELMP